MAGILGYRYLREIVSAHNKCLQRKKQFKQKQHKAQHGAKGAEMRERIKAPGLERDEVKGKNLGFPYTFSLCLAG